MQSNATDMKAIACNDAILNCGQLKNQEIDEKRKKKESCSWLCTPLYFLALT